VLKVVLADEGTGRGFPDSVESYQRAVYLLKGVGQEGGAELPFDSCLHALKKIAYFAGLRPVQRNCGNPPAVHARLA
jgi:hypothetical protein